MSKDYSKACKYVVNLIKEVVENTDTESTKDKRLHINASLFFDAPKDMPDQLDEFTFTTKFPEDVQNAFIEDKPSMKKIWKNSALYTTSMRDEGNNTHAQIINRFQRALNQHKEKGGANFYVIVMQAWVTPFIEASRKVPTIQDMPLDDRQESIVIMDMLKHADRANVQYARIDSEGKIGSEWIPARLPEDPQDENKEGIAW